MANLDLEHKINVPFAEKGNKINIPDTSQSGTVNMTDGFGSKYDTPIAEGGEYIYREEMNEILYKVYAAVKELQELAVTAGFPIDMTKALNVLDIPHGGTGGNNATEARSNLGLGSLATKSTITSSDIANNAVTNTKINDGAVTTSKIADTAVTANKLASSAVTNAKIAANAVSSDKIVNNAITNAKVANNAITDNKLSGIISTAHGGLGNDYGKASYVGNISWTLLGMSAGTYTTQQLVDAIVKNLSKLTGEFNMGWIWKSGSSSVTISDLPFNPSTLRIKVIDNNGIIMEAFPPYQDCRKAIGLVKGGVFGGWQFIYTINANTYRIDYKYLIVDGSYLTQFARVANTTNNGKTLPSVSDYGTVISLASDTGSQYLPAGGTWFAYYFIQYKPNKDLHYDSFVTVQAGGSKVGNGDDGTYTMNGFAIKIR